MRAWSSVSSSSRPTSRSGRTCWPAAGGAGASSRSGSPSTPTSRPAGARRGRAGPNLPEEYRRTLDPFVALDGGRGVTSRLRLGTGICLVAQHDPIVLAKTVASLDLVSGGRLTLGIGVGWNEDEMDDHGVDPPAGGPWSGRRCSPCSELWTEDEAVLRGRVRPLRAVWSWPKPVQRRIRPS